MKVKPKTELVLEPGQGPGLAIAPTLTSLPLPLTAQTLRGRVPTRAASPRLVPAGGADGSLDPAVTPGTTRGVGR